LSREIYEAFGEEAGQRMVDWMDSVERNRADLREMNDLAFARVDARFGEFEARFRQRLDESRHATAMEFALVREEMHLGFASLREEMHLGFAHLEARMERRFTNLMKWATVFWVGSAATLAGTLIAVARWGP
jgi:hypothetical protein